MRTFLRWLLNFIETRFPEKVMVTQKSYDNLEALNIQLADSHNKLVERVEKLEAETNKFNYAMGFGGMPKGRGNTAECAVSGGSYNAYA